MKDSPVKAGLLGGVKKKNVSAAGRGLDSEKVAEGDTLLSGWELYHPTSKQQEGQHT